MIFCEDKTKMLRGGGLEETSTSAKLQEKNTNENNTQKTAPKFFDNIFSIKNLERYSAYTDLIYKHKQITLLGLKFKIKKGTTKPQKPDLTSLYIDYSDLLYLSLYNDLKNYKNLKEDYLNLIKGLDEKSIELVDRSLNALQNSNGVDKFKVEYFDYELDLVKKADMLHNSIVKLDENLWAYKNYLLSYNLFPYEVFISNFAKEEFTNLNPEKSIIDAGAFIGDSAIVLSDLTNKNVYAFEPILPVFEKLKRTIELNHLQNKIIPVNKCFSNENKTIELHYDSQGFNGCSSLDNIRQFGEIQEAQAITLDDFVNSNNIEVGLIKADIEGAEQLLLKGAINTIKTQRPHMIISIYHNISDYFKIKPMIENLNLNYKFKIRKGNPKTAIGETVLICEPQK